ncbi:MAG: RNA polymerase sigma factor [Clostridiales bacterium]|nr:RNA polymerase sigma factor [Clostridiales bacterium]
MSQEKTTVQVATIAKDKPALPDPGDLMAVVAHYQGSLLRYVGRMLGGSDNEVEDIVQETFIRLHFQISKEGRDSVKNLTTWLFKTSQNLTIDAFRKGARRVKVLESASKAALLTNEQAGKELDVMGEVLRHEAREVALRELGELDEQYRQVVLLKIIQGMTLREVAEVAGISTSLANYRLNKGLEELTQRLKKAGVV